jgi:nucleotide-binding universal stress UspA family protein
VNATSPGHATYRRIGVSLDGTPESEQALQWAITIARRAHCAIDLAHVRISSPAPPEFYGSRASEEKLEEERTAVMRRLTALTSDIERRGVPANASILDGAIPTALVDHFHAAEVDLIAMTTHDPGRIEHLLFGSVTESVARRADVPVLVVHPTDGNTSLESPIKLGRVLVPLDGSPFSEEILPHAATFARVMQVDITLVGVLQPMLTVATAALAAKPNTSELDGAATMLRETAGLVVTTDVLSDGQPAHAIAAYAEEHAIGLIAMTTHGRGALKRAFTGSVSEAVLRKTRLPMLLYHPRAE